MRLALVQQRATPDKQANVARGLAALDAAAAGGAKLACFAELAFEPFYPQHRPGPTSPAWPSRSPDRSPNCSSGRPRSSRWWSCSTCSSGTGTRTFDSSPVIDADGRLLGCTRMIHITEYACFHEQGYYTPGDTGAPVYETAVGRVGVAICYDRHFPEYMRALALGGAELVVVPQAGSVGEWPEGLYQSELQVAAFQNGYFTALCNRVGEEECLTFGGESFVCAPNGSVIANAPALEETILYADVDLDKVERSHARRLFMKHRRPELYGGWLERR